MGLLPPLALLSLPMARPPADAVVCDDCAWLPPDRLILLRKPPFFFGWSAGASFLSVLSVVVFLRPTCAVEDEPPARPFAPASTVVISAAGLASQVMCSL